MYQVHVGHKHSHFSEGQKMGGSCLADYCSTNTKFTLPSYDLSCFSTREKQPKGKRFLSSFPEKTTQVYFYDVDCFIVTFAFIYLKSQYCEGVECKLGTNI